MIRWLRDFAYIHLSAMCLGILAEAGSPHPPARGDGWLFLPSVGGSGNSTELERVQTLWSLCDRLVGLFIEGSFVQVPPEEGNYLKLCRKCAGAHRFTLETDVWKVAGALGTQPVLPHPGPSSLCLGLRDTYETWEGEGSGGTHRPKA